MQAAATLALTLGHFSARGEHLPCIVSDPKICFCRTFVICLCGIDDAEHNCECPGEVRFEKNLEEGGTIILFPLFVDPLTKSNWVVKLTLLDTSQPSPSHELGFSLGLEGQDGGAVLEGEAHIEVND